ncbi:heavy metal translocating P-type ATPase [Marichromatium gracile]|uniref:ATPase P n=1 Tax=Marichromatium gracile TaxID=1048 RepID=A0ABR5VHG9_MARGR|nr:heavy metal translocating P-type ATPase [Marichromatium gracile]KXX65032.1 ATPase P [Marichromatium gracile]
MDAIIEEHAPATGEAPARCHHCGLPIGPGGGERALIAGVERRFCCSGCKGVCEAIHAAGLEGFYRRTGADELLAPPPERPRDLEHYDLDAVQQAFTDTSARCRDIQLQVEGIHCAACVWLIENGLQSLPGVEEARVNLTGRRLRLRWDSERLRLSRVLARLAALGYAAVPFDPEAAEGALARENRDLLFRLAWAGFAMMNLLWISIALYSGADQGEFRGLFHWLGFALATPTLLYSGAPFFRGAWAGLRHARLGMDLPIAIGVIVTYGYSLAVTLGLGDQGHVYWDTVVNFLFVILLGRYLEAISRRRAVASTQRLFDLQPRVATVLDAQGEARPVAVRAITPGMTVLVRPGERIAVDGEVIAGESGVDESMLSGESRPVAKGPGATVAAGTLNGAGALRLRVGGVLAETALGRIIALVESAQSSRAPIQRLADRVVPWFVAATLGLALVTFMVWVRHDLESALMAATAVLIVTCPCAFGLATPMAVAVASGRGAARGILIKHGAVLERLSAIRHLVFDKTGTLTEGRARVVALRAPGEDWRAPETGLTEAQRAALAALGALEQHSEHPLARAVVACCTALGVAHGGLTVAGFVALPGRGVRARVAGREVLAGSAEWLAGAGIALPEGEPGEVCCAIDGELVLALRIEDRLRADAARALARLRAAGMRLTLLSGDRAARAREVAGRLGGMATIAEVLPEDKARVVERLRAEGAAVAMVGDGVNDAPALVAADVGIAMGSGTDVSIECADIVLMTGELERVVEAVVLARRTLRAIRQNIAISMTYNLIMVPLAMAGIITPLIAAVSMPLSSLAVIANSARIRPGLDEQPGPGRAPR